MWILWWCRHMGATTNTESIPKLFVVGKYQLMVSRNIVYQLIPLQILAKTFKILKIKRKPYMVATQKIDLFRTLFCKLNADTYKIPKTWRYPYTMTTSISGSRQNLFYENKIVHNESLKSKIPLIQLEIVVKNLHVQKIGNDNEIGNS